MGERLGHVWVPGGPVPERAVLVGREERGQVLVDGRGERGVGAAVFVLLGEEALDRRGQGYLGAGGAFDRLAHPGIGVGHGRGPNLRAQPGPTPGPDGGGPDPGVGILGQ